QTRCHALKCEASWIADRRDSARTAQGRSLLLPSLPHGRATGRMHCPPPSQYGGFLGHRMPAARPQRVAPVSREAVALFSAQTLRHRRSYQQRTRKWPLDGQTKRDLDVSWIHDTSIRLSWRRHGTRFRATHEFSRVSDATTAEMSRQSPMTRYR